MNRTGIYSIKNKITGKVYVGQAINIKNRIAGHFKRLNAGKHHCAHLQLSYQKYGKENFIYSVLEECSKERLTEREQYWMDYYRDRGLYNTAPAAGSNAGMKFSAEVRAKMAAKLTGRPVSEETRAKMSRSRMGWSPSDETRAKMSVAKRNLSDETKKKMSEAHKGKTHSFEVREKMSKVRKGKHFGHILTKEECANRKGCKLSDELKAKVSLSLIGNTRRVGAVNSAETRAKLSAASIKSWKKRKTDNLLNLKENYYEHC
jgi:group I intron endonuclease